MIDIQEVESRFVEAPGPAGMIILLSPEGRRLPRREVEEIPQLVLQARAEYLQAKEERENLTRAATDSLHRHRAEKAALETSDEVRSLESRIEELKRELDETRKLLGEARQSTKARIDESWSRHTSVLREKAHAASECERRWRVYRNLDKFTKPAQNTINFEQYER